MRTIIRLKNSLRARAYLSRFPAVEAQVREVYKILSLPSRFYRLKNEFARLAAWIDTKGAHLYKEHADLAAKHSYMELRLSTIETKLHLTSNREQLHRQGEDNLLSAVFTEQGFDVDKFKGIIRNRLPKDLPPRLSQYHQQQAAYHSMYPYPPGGDFATHVQRLMEEVALLRHRVNEILTLLETAPARSLSTELQELKRVVSAYAGHREEIERRLSSLEERHKQIHESVSGAENGWADIRQKLSAEVENNLQNLKHQTSLKLDELKFQLIRTQPFRQQRLLESRKADPLARQPYKSPSQEVNSMGNNHSVEQLYSEANGFGLSQAVDYDYFAFEHYSRGSREEVKERQSHYLAQFKGIEKVVDLGCGRGEFLELLAEAGIEAIGVECSDDLADFCQSLRLRVIREDAADFLSKFPVATLPGLFASHFLQCLPPVKINQCLRLCSEKLRSGGLLVLEEVNPECHPALVGLLSAPSYRKPLSSPFLSFLLEQNGFRINSHYLCGPIICQAPPVANYDDAHSGQYRNYAMIARRL